MKRSSNLPSALWFDEKDIAWRRNIIDLAIIFGITFFIYAWSAPRTVGLEDDGYFLLAAYYNGIAHPPGYPLYTFLAHLATLIPVGSVALRVHIFSGFLGALACVCLWGISRILIRDRTAAYTAALSLAFSRVFWSQAIIAKGIYTLNVFLILLAFLCVLSIRKEKTVKEASWNIRILFLCYGLALSNHWPLVILSTPMFIAALWRYRNVVPQLVMKGLPFLLLGLTPYLWMAIRSQMNPEIIFFGPIETIPDFWHYLTRQPYVDIDNSPSADWMDKLQYVKYALLQSGGQFGVFGWLFALAGVVSQWRILPKDLCAALLLGYLGSSVFLSLLLGFDYEEYHKSIFSVYPLISYVICALWLGIGLTTIVQFLTRKLVTHATQRIIPTAIAALIILSTLLANAAWNFRHNDAWARQYTVTILNSLPRGAILFADGLAEGAIAYMNKIEGYRNDIELYSVRGILLNNRIYHPLKSNLVQARNAVNEFIQSRDRPIYYISGLLQDYGIEYYGLYSRVLKNKPKTASTAVILPVFLAYWNSILSERPRHPWEKIHRRTLLENGCNLLTITAETPIPNRTDFVQIEDMHSRICDNLQGSYIMINAEIHRDQPDWGKIKLLLEKAAGQLNEALLKSDIAKLDYYRGIMYLQTGQKEKGGYFLERSLSEWNHPDNEAGVELKKLEQLKQ